jgi:hypothetical protein
VSQKALFMRFLQARLPEWLGYLLESLSNGGEMGFETPPQHVFVAYVEWLKENPHGDFGQFEKACADSLAQFLSMS